MRTKKSLLSRYFWGGREKALNSIECYMYLIDVFLRAKIGDALECHSMDSSVQFGRQRHRIACVRLGPPIDFYKICFQECKNNNPLATRLPKGLIIKSWWTCLYNFTDNVECSMQILLHFSCKSFERITYLS